MAEGEAAHRRLIGKSIVEGELKQQSRDSDEASRGQLCGLAIALESLAAGTFVAMNGHEWSGTVLGVGGMGGIVTTFILAERLRGWNLPLPDNSASQSGSGNSEQNH